MNLSVPNLNRIRTLCLAGTELPGFTIELNYSSTLILEESDWGSKPGRFGKLPLEQVLQLFIEGRLGFLRKFHACSRQEAAKIYARELAEFKDRYSVPRRTKCMQF